jgi:heme A synthase
VNAYRKYALFTLAATVAVIVWGAYVRASGSGAGCGAHWPLCNGVLIPETEAQKTWVEFSHRLSSGVLISCVGGLLVWAWRLFPRSSFAFRAAAVSFLAVWVEAFVGAFLVLLGLVEKDKSVLRVWSVSLHLANTLFLLAALTCAALAPRMATPRWRWPARQSPWWPRCLVLGFVLLGAFGAVAALGDTLFPPSSVIGGIAADWNGQGHVAERIRVLHPLLAVSWAGAFAYWMAGLWERLPMLRRIGQKCIAVAALNLCLGLLNIALLAPLWLQMLHLAIANLLWIVFVAALFSAASNPEFR